MNYKKNYIILGIFASAAIGSVYIGGKLASRFKNEIAISNPVSRSLWVTGSTDNNVGCNCSMLAITCSPFRMACQISQEELWNALCHYHLLQKLLGVHVH